MITRLATNRTVHHGSMTENRPHSITDSLGNPHDYLPAAGHDAFLPGYDLLTRVLGFNRA